MRTLGLKQLPRSTRRGGGAEAEARRPPCAQGSLGRVGTGHLTYFYYLYRYVLGTDHKARGRYRTYAG